MFTYLVGVDVIHMKIRVKSQGLYQVIISAIPSWSVSYMTVVVGLVFVMESTKLFAVKNQYYYTLQDGK